MVKKNVVGLMFGLACVLFALIWFSAIATMDFDFESDSYFGLGMMIATPILLAIAGVISIMMSWGKRNIV